MIRSQVSRLSLQVRQQLLVPLYANAFALIFNQASSAVLGIIYWAAVAHLFSADVVGQNTAIISVVMLLSTLAEFSLKSAMTRFIPRAGRRVRGLIIYTYLANVVLSFVIAVVFFSLGSYFHFTSILLSETKLLPYLIFLAPAAWTIFYVQDGVLIGLRETKWVLYENLIYNVLKIILLGLIFFTGHRYGIVISWFLPTPILIVLVNWMVFFRYIPNRVAEKTDVKANITVKEVASSVGRDHIGTIFAETCIRLLPLLVLNLVGKDANAYFYQAWLIGNTIYLMAYNLASSFSVEASSNLQQIALYSRRILLQKARLIVPLAVGVFIFAPIGLRIFGEDYAEQGTVLLRLLALAALPMILNIWYLGYARVTGELGGVIINQGLTAVITLGLSYLWLPTLGITAVGIAWLIAQTFVALIVIVKTAHVLLGNTIGHNKDLPASINMRLRRADWRFLSSVAEPKRSVVFENGLLHSAVESITTGVTRKGDFVKEGGFDLAVAVNPSWPVLKSIYAGLNDDGAFYSEWSSWRLGGAAAVKRRLQKVGFSDVRMFWAYPSVDNPHVWLPLDVDPAPYLYLSNQFMPGDGQLRQSIRKLMSFGLRVLVSIGAVRRLSVIAYKKVIDTDVMTVVRKEWLSQNNQQPNDRFSYLMQTGGIQLLSKIVFLVFLESDAVPRWVVKLPRLQDDAKTLKEEENILSSLNNGGFEKSDGVIVPRIILSRTWNGFYMTAQTALSGTPLSKLVKQENLEDLSKRLVDWQIQLAKISRRNSDHSSGAQIVKNYSDKLELVGAKNLMANELAKAHQILSKLNSVPAVNVHNDFAPWNVIATDAGLGVFDWADANSVGLPALDLVYGLSNLIFISQDAWDIQYKVQVYRSLLDPKSASGKLFDSCLKRYAEAVGFSSDLIAPLRLATWILHCHFEYMNRQIEQAPERLAFQDESICLSLLRIELQAQQI
jgi:O-antigen/teichoic acid export membrane protein/thiamine kinase-like enzyme